MVGIDEAQFFDAGIVEVAQKLAYRGTRVICAGLDMDFQRPTLRTNARTFSSC